MCPNNFFYIIKDRSLLINFALYSEKLSCIHQLEYDYLHMVSELLRNETDDCCICLESLDGMRSLIHLNDTHLHSVKTLIFNLEYTSNNINSNLQKMRLFILLMSAY